MQGVRERELELSAWLLVGDLTNENSSFSLPEHVVEGSL